MVAVRPIAWFLRLAAVVSAGALLITAVVVAFAPRAWQAANAHEQVPVALPSFDGLSQRTYVYDVAGDVIAVFERENSQPIHLAQVPVGVVKAILAVEDNSFYEHKGVNVRSLIRATLSNFSSDAPRQGASTITQQVVKNELLAGLERDGRYKLLQVHYALMLEKKMTKDAILERYLNTIFFGNNAYGLQAAAEVYFGKNVEQLSTIEGVFLAGLIRSPSGYDPIRKPERSRARFRQVVQRLVDVHMVSSKQGGWLGDNWVLPEQLRSVSTISAKPTYFTEALREYLLTNPTVNILGDSEQERANLLFRGGLRIYTTLDPRLQTLAEQARTKLPDTAAGIDAAIVSLDSKTGAVRAMVGGRGFGTGPNQSQINMALVPRQTGSSIKLFILSAAIQAGAQPDDQIDGRRGCVLPNPGDPTHPFIITGGTTGSLGALNQATWASLNCAFARLSQIVGLNRVVDTVYRMAHSAYLYGGQPKEDREPLQPYASFATGANEMAPIDMASGAQTLANNGLHHDPYYVDYIERSDGTRMYTHDDPGVQVLDVGAALTTTDILKGVLRRGTAKRSLADFPFPAAGKTGTQQDNTNSWFVGYTPALATAVWVGDPDGYTPMTRKYTPEFYDLDGVDAVQGGTYPARIWGAYTEPAIAGLPVEDWYPPLPPVRPAARLFLPGEECAYELVSGVLIDPLASTTTATIPAETAPPETLPPETYPPETYPATINPDTGDTIPGEVIPGQAPGEVIPTETIPEETTTVAPVVIRLMPATTIAPNVVDPRAPLPSIDPKIPVFPCAALPVGVIAAPGTAPPVTSK